MGATGVSEEVSEEVVPAKVVCAPCLPSPEEVEAHNAIHIPFRSWCAHCVSGTPVALFKKILNLAQGTLVFLFLF